VVEFTNQSAFANGYEWTFGDASTTNEEHPIHTYSTDPSTYDVQLVAFGTPGDPNCVDTAVMTIEILDELLFHIPNTFTPDQDDFNETFQPVFISGFDPYDFTLLIFDRWGEILFESHDATVGWDGKYGGKIVKDGTYIWKIDFKETMSDKRHSEMGHINVLR
jgi:gliding motility-associated-like protein